MAFTISVNSSASGAQRRTRRRNTRSLTPAKGDWRTRQGNWRDVVSLAVQAGVPVLGLSASLGYFDMYRAARLPANLIQAQRDYFGAHTYQRIDREGTFHTEWASA